jgi:serine/threonine-protein kinase
MKMENGTIINQYKIISAIGKGGMGEVFLAQDTKLDRKVAIKFLNQEFSKDADKLNRFIREAKAVSALNHPNILTVYEIGDTDDTNYIVTEFIEGKTLCEHLSPRESLQLNQILKIGVQVAEALSAAHQAGIIHRDIKPENIMIRKDGYAKVLDFGLAKLSESPASAGGTNVDSEDATKVQVKTTPGMVMGTVPYMSPEQARGNPTDARTDVWSLGVILYEMLAGKVPFSGETANHTIVAILEKEPLLLDNVPDQLQRIVRKSLTKDVEMRYQSARDLLIDLKNLRRELDMQGELERSVIPNREAANTSTENATQMLGGGGESTISGQTAATQNVTTSSSSLEYAVTQAKSHKLVTAVVVVLAIGVIAAVGYFGFLSKGNGSGQINSIAIMPFVNESGNADIEYLSDGMTETLISSLSQLPNLSVKPRSSVFRYKGKESNTQAIGKELNVQAILNGRVVQHGQDLSLFVELIDVVLDKVVWSQQYTRKQTDLVSLQSEVARDVSSKLKSKLSGADEAKVTKTHTTNPEAYQLYLKGRFHWNKRTTESLKQAADFFKQAIEKDPNYALAYSGLADTYALFADYSVGLTKDSMPQAKAAAQRALELDDSLAAPHATLGTYLIIYEWDRVGGEKEFRRAIELDPTYATAHQWFASEMLAAAKRFDEALTELRRAEELDPLSPIIGTNLGDVLVHARRYDEAIAQYKRTLSLEPNFAYAHQALGWAYGFKGMYPEAIAETRKSFELNHDPQTQGYLGLWLAKSGGRDEAMKLLDQLKQESAQRYVPGGCFALIYIGLNEKEEALNWLEKEISNRSPGTVNYGISPDYDDLRSDPRFKAMLKRLNLPE